MLPSMSPVPLYRHLASVYDQLFPLDPEALAFVESSLGTLEGRRIVDAGCGTGLLARGLGDRGAQVFAFDLDPDLLGLAQGRSTAAVRFVPGDLRTWLPPPEFGQADLVLCFGNTLPHLTQEAEVETFFLRTARALAPDGRLLLQTLDYDYLESTQTLVLPPRVVGDTIFHRHYEILPNGLWRFHTRLTGPQGEASNAFELCPWRRGGLEALLVRCGYVVEGVFGGFDGRAPGASLPLVLRARLA